MNIKFYTANLKPCEPARFCLILDAPYGEHHCNGAIIHSQAEDKAVVLWPKLGPQFAFPRAQRVDKGGKRNDPKDLQGMECQKMTSHDEHYRRMSIQPIEVMEMILRRENIPPVARAHIATAGHYLNRAGEKGDWREDVEKGMNYLHRALHGVWPWDEPDIDAIKKALDNPIQRMCDAEHPPSRHCGCVECEKSFAGHCDGTPNIPAQDSGEELVGRECWVWDTCDVILATKKEDAAKARVLEYDSQFIRLPYLVWRSDEAEERYQHARPVELGHPDPGHPEYRGER